MTQRQPAQNVSLWDVDASIAAVKVRDTTIAPVGMRDVDEFCHRYHYTAVAGNAAWRWGLWHGPTLLGVVAYNLPTRETQESVFGPEHFEHVWHMGRLALAEEAPHNSESRLIAGSLRLVQQAHPEVWAVLTYAAVDAGHIGYVYQATNAIYTGTGGIGSYYTDRNGAWRANNHTNIELATAKGWVRHLARPKHRYIYVLGSKTQRRQRLRLLRFEPMPYPKPGDGDVPRASGLPETIRNNGLPAGTKLRETLSDDTTPPEMDDLFGGTL